MPKANRVAYVDAEHRITLKQEPAPEPGPGQVLVELKANGICGSDLHFWREGRLGNFVVTRPYVPGHEACGVVVALGDGARGFASGDRVVIEPGMPCGRCRYCRAGRYNLCPDVVFLSAPPVNGTFCDYLAIRADALHRLPEAMDFEQGALVEPAAVGVHAVNRAGPCAGKTALVLGCGPIGLVTLQAFKAAGGARVACVDRIPYRLEKALALGADTAHNADEDDALLACAADVVFETAGSAAATAAAVRYAAPGGRIVQVGWPESPLVSLNVADLMEKELEHVGVNRYANAFPTAMAWIADGRIRAAEMITHRFGLDDIVEAFHTAHEQREQVIKAVVLN
jgi:L-iditol 2-dehydrogenase